MTKKKLSPPNTATQLMFGGVQAFQRCCSAKVGYGMYLTGHKQKEPSSVNRTIKANLGGALQFPFNESGYKKLQSAIPASLRKWPIRIYYSFLLGHHLEQLNLKKGVNRNFGLTPRLLSLADNIDETYYGANNRNGVAKLHQGGSGYAEWLKTVPGVRVISTGKYNGAHNTDCAGYMVIFEDTVKIEKFLTRTKGMITTRINKLKNDPVRIKKGLNSKVAPPVRADGLVLDF